MRECYFEERGISYRISERILDRPTLVLLHGLTGSASAWYPYEPELEAAFNLVSLDLRGHGKSIRPRRYAEYAPKEFVTDVERLLASLGLRNVILVGHSLGALVALELSLAGSPAVACTVLLSPIHGVRSGRFTGAVSLFLSLAAGVLGLFGGRPAGGRVDYARFQNTSDWNTARIAADLRNTGLHTYIFCLKQLFNANGDGKWRSINLPLAILHGRKDTIVPCAQAETLAKDIPGARLVILENTDHMLVLNNRDEIIETVKTFAQSVCRRPRREC